MTPPAPLLVTRDELLLDDLLRLSAASGVTPEVAHDGATALRSWPAASVVVVGADLAAHMADQRPPRRGHVHVVARGRAPDELFRTAVALGAQSVSDLPACEAWLIELLTDSLDGATTPGRLVGVIPGSGGAGATVFAVALAVELARTREAMLIDADPLGPGVDRVLGMEQARGVRWDALHSATGRLSARSLREALPVQGRLSVLAWGSERPDRLQPFAVREVVSAAQRAYGHVVIDLPRHRDQVIDEVLARCDDVVLVSGVNLSAVASSARVVARLEETSATTHLVTRGSGGVLPEEIARVLGVRLASAMHSQRGLDEAIDLGSGPVRSRRCALAKASREVARCLTSVSLAA